MEEEVEYVPLHLCQKTSLGGRQGVEDVLGCSYLVQIHHEEVPAALLVLDTVPIRQSEDLPQRDSDTPSFLENDERLQEHRRLLAHCMPVGVHATPC